MNQLCHGKPLRKALRFLVSACLLLLLSPTGASADCRPVATGVHPSGDFNRGLLWKIEAPGIAPSHLFGTFHSNDPRIVRLPCPVKHAFDGASSYTMEMIMNGNGIVSMAEAMYFVDGKNLRQVLGESLFRETIEGLGLPAGQADAIINMKPWAVMMMLSAPRQGGGLFLDFSLQLDATRQGKPTFGLETMQEQIEVFNGMSLDDQVVLLRDAIRSRRQMAGVMEELTHVYLQRDLEGLMRLSEKYQSEDARVHRDLMDRLLAQRNRNMASRMAERLKEGNTFIAVGALHLPGEQGLLRLLTSAGYRVTAVY